MSRFDVPVITTLLIPAEYWERIIAAKTVIRVELKSKFTLRRERRKYGDLYWTAYKSINGKLYRKYVGLNESLTIEKLQELDRHFADLKKVIKKESKNG